MKLPPAEFSNVINSVKPGFDFFKWETSPEWAIFNAGRKDAANTIIYHTQNIESEARKHIIDVRYEIE
jgi:hypothetical protein